MIATLLDTKTGKTEKIDGMRSYIWAEHNWSCDCNRCLYFEDDGDGPDPYKCESKRFLVIDAEMDMKDDYSYTLSELNDGYPLELIEKHIGSRKDIVIPNKNFLVD